jgi:hypothetical protein
VLGPVLLFLRDNRMSRTIPRSLPMSSMQTSARQYDHDARTNEFI